MHQWHLKTNDKHDLTDCGRVVMFYASVTIVCSYMRSWSYGSWFYYYLCNQCLSPLTLRVRILLWWGVHIYNIMWKGLSVTCGRSMVSPGTPVSSTDKTDHHDKNDILPESGIKHHNPKPRTLSNILRTMDIYLLILLKHIIYNAD